MTEADIVNLTPHELNFVNEDGEEILSIEPSGQVARVDTEHVWVGETQGVPRFEEREGEIENLPEPEEDVIYVVSGRVKSAVDRRDVLSPGKLIRDEDGNPVGALGLNH